MVCNRGLHGLG